MGFLGVFGGVGLGRFGYSAILPSMQDGLHLDSASAGALASWNFGGYTLMAAASGLLAYRFGPRLVVSIGSLVAALGMLFTGLSGGMVSASAGRLLTGLGSGAVLVPSVALMSSWFDTRRRGMACGVVASGPALAMVISGPVVPLVIGAGGAAGWRYAWYLFAALTLAVGILTLVVQRDRPYSEATPPASEGDRFSSRRDPGEGDQARLSSVLRSLYAWHAGFIYLAFGFAYMVYLTFFQRRLITDLNLTSTMAGTYFLVLGLASMACGFLWGTISDHIGRGRALALNCLLQAGAAALLAWWPSTVGTVLSVLLCGLTAVAVPGIVGAGCGDRFGPVLASTSLGFVTVFLGAGQVLGPYLAGLLDDAHGSLEYSYALAAGVYLVGAVLSITLRDARSSPVVGVRRSV